MKKIIIMILSLSLILGLTACGGKTSEIKTFSTDDVEFQYDASKISIDGQPERNQDDVWTLFLHGIAADGKVDYSNYAVLNFANTLEFEQNLSEFSSELNGNPVNETKIGERTFRISKSEFAQDGIDVEEGDEKAWQTSLYTQIENGDVSMKICAVESYDIDPFVDILKDIKIKHDFSKEFADGYKYLIDYDMKVGDKTVPVKVVKRGTILDKPDNGYLSCSYNDTMLTLNTYNKGGNLSDILILYTGNVIDGYAGYLRGSEVRAEKPVITENMAYNTIIFYDGNTPLKILSVGVKKVTDTDYMMILIERENPLNQEEVKSPFYFELAKAYGFSDYAKEVPPSTDSIDLW